jgi:hypothetical protein
VLPAVPQVKQQSQPPAAKKPKLHPVPSAKLQQQPAAAAAASQQTSRVNSSRASDGTGFSLPASQPTKAAAAALQGFSAQVCHSCLMDSARVSPVASGHRSPCQECLLVWPAMS